MSSIISGGTSWPLSCSNYDKVPTKNHHPALESSIYMDKQLTHGPRSFRNVCTTWAWDLPAVFPPHLPHPLRWTCPCRCAKRCNKDRTGQQALGFRYKGRRPVCNYIYIYYIYVHLYINTKYIMYIICVLIYTHMNE